MNTLITMPKIKPGPEGTWTIASAKNRQGKSYSGTVQVQPLGRVYTVSWLTTVGDYSGPGFFEDGYLFAGCGFNDAFGLVLYKINEDGTLDGKWTQSSHRGAVDLEKAVGGIPGQVEGSYKINGTVLSSGVYQGELDINQIDDIYQLSWSIGNQYQGVGLRVGDWLVACWGVGQVYLHYYEIQGYQAKGRWTVVNQSFMGEENLERIC